MQTSAMRGYGQFCAIAQAAEVLTERWTPLVLRELALTGSRRFNDIQRGVPLMSSSLLSKRLRQLERAGIIERRQRSAGKGSEYHLTPAGEELGPVFAQLGVWSERWLRRPIFEETPDTGLLMWWVRTTVKTDALPAGRSVIHFRFRGAPEKLRYFWLVLPEADLCLSDDRPELLPGGSQMVFAALAVRALSALNNSRTLELTQALGEQRGVPGRAVAIAQQEHSAPDYPFRADQHPPAIAPSGTFRPASLADRLWCGGVDAQGIPRTPTSLHVSLTMQREDERHGPVGEELPSETSAFLIPMRPRYSR